MTIKNIEKKSEAGKPAGNVGEVYLYKELPEKVKELFEEEFKTVPTANEKIIAIDSGWFDYIESPDEDLNDTYAFMVRGDDGEIYYVATDGVETDSLCCVRSVVDEDYDKDVVYVVKADWEEIADNILFDPDFSEVATKAEIMDVSCYIDEEEVEITAEYKGEEYVFYFSSKEEGVHGRYPNAVNMLEKAPGYAIDVVMRALSEFETEEEFDGYEIATRSHGSGKSLYSFPHCFVVTVEHIDKTGNSFFGGNEIAAAWFFDNEEDARKKYDSIKR